MRRWLRLLRRWALVRLAGGQAVAINTQIEVLGGRVYVQPRPRGATAFISLDRPVPPLTVRDLWMLG